MAVCKTPPPARLPHIRGLKMATAPAGIRYSDRDDLTLFALDKGANIGGIFTRNQIPGEPVIWNRELAKHGAVNGNARGILVIAGNANVHCGAEGAAASRRWAEAAAKQLGCRAEEIWLAATGVIGETPPRGRVERALPKLTRNLQNKNWRAVSRAIWTTDTVEKAAGRQTSIGDAKVALAVVAKGSGMIAPDMATMLCFAFTDAALPPPLLRALLREAAAPFGHISVDGYPSTSDMVLFAATGATAHAPVRKISDKALVLFRRALREAMYDVALSVVGDGEGASAVVELRVTGAPTDAAAERIVRGLAASPLVRTAFAGRDPNWGRLLQVAGALLPRTPRIVPEQISVFFDGLIVVRGGGVVSREAERRAARLMRQEQYSVTVDLDAGKSHARLFTCDLTKDYVDINASYRS